MAIAGCVTVCLEAFRNLSTVTSQGEKIENYAAIMPRVSDEFGRFKVWSSNIGAHRSGRSSLDYRLRDASHIQKRVLELLGDLSQSLDEASAITTGDMIPWDEMPAEPEEPWDEDETAATEEEMATTELGQILMDVNEINTDLMRLSKAMRNPAPHERFMNAVSTDTSYFNEHDQRYVADKFPKAEPFLLARLAKALSRRRQFFKYREHHQNKLRQGLLTDHDDTSTVASSLPPNLKVEKISAADFDTGSESGLSQTSFADSSEDSERPHIPSLASEYMNGEPFECPLCFLLITINSGHSWKKHVFNDLRPYVCLVKDCTAPDYTFARRHDWIIHEHDHDKQWSCVLCSQVFVIRLKLEQHIQQNHHNVSDKNQLEKMANMGEVSSTSTVDVVCPLCRDITLPRKDYQSHVGRHQQDLTIFALPSLPPEFLDDEGSEHDHKDSASSDEDGNNDDIEPVSLGSPADERTPTVDEDDDGDSFVAAMRQAMREEDDETISVTSSIFTTPGEAARGSHEVAEPPADAPDESAIHVASDKQLDDLENDLEEAAEYSIGHNRPPDIVDLLDSDNDSVVFNKRRPSAYGISEEGHQGEKILEGKEKDWRSKIEYEELKEEQRHANLEMELEETRQAYLAEMEEIRQSFLAEMDVKARHRPRLEFEAVKRTEEEERLEIIRRAEQTFDNSKDSGSTANGISTSRDHERSTEVEQGETKLGRRRTMEVEEGNEALSKKKLELARLKERFEREEEEAEHLRKLKAKKVKRIEDETRERLSKFGFQENQIEAVLDPGKASNLGFESVASSDDKIKGRRSSQDQRDADAIDAKNQEVKEWLTIADSNDANAIAAYNAKVSEEHDKNRESTTRFHREEEERKRVLVEAERARMVQKGPDAVAAWEKEIAEKRRIQDQKDSKAIEAYNEKIKAQKENDEALRGRLWVQEELRNVVVENEEKSRGEKIREAAENILKKVDQEQRWKDMVKKENERESEIQEVKNDPTTDSMKAMKTHASSEQLRRRITPNFRHDPAPTYIKVHKSHVDIESLKYFGLPWEYDTNPDYIIILQEMDTNQTELLFEHTRKLRRARTGVSGMAENPESSE